MQIHNYEEIIGILNKVEFNKNQDAVTLVFTFQKKIDVPINVCDKEILVSHIGKKIAVLQIDGDFKFRTIKGGEVWLLFVKPVGCKISNELYQIIQNEIGKLGITKSDFFRMLINNYFKDHK